MHVVDHGITVRETPLWNASHGMRDDCATQSQPPSHFMSPHSRDPPHRDGSSSIHIHTPDVPSALSEMMVHRRCTPVHSYPKVGVIPNLWGLLCRSRETSSCGDSTCYSRYGARNGSVAQRLHFAPGIKGEVPRGRAWTALVHSTPCTPCLLQLTEELRCHTLVNAPPVVEVLRGVRSSARVAQGSAGLLNVADPPSTKTSRSATTRRPPTDKPPQCTACSALSRHINRILTCPVQCASPVSSFATRSPHA